MNPEQQPQSPSQSQPLNFDAFANGLGASSTGAPKPQTSSWSGKLQSLYEGQSGSAGNPAPQQSYLGRAGNDIMGTFNDIGSGLKQAFTAGSEGNLGTALSSGLAGGMKALTAPIAHGFQLIGDLTGLSDVARGGINMLFNTPEGQKLQGALQSGDQAYQQWAQEHPELAKNVNNLTSMANSFSNVLGLGLTGTAKKSVEDAFAKATEDTIGQTLKNVGVGAAKGAAVGAGFGGVSGLAQGTETGTPLESTAKGIAGGATAGGVAGAVPGTLELGKKSVQGAIELGGNAIQGAKNMFGGMFAKVDPKIQNIIDNLPEDQKAAVPGELKTYLDASAKRNADVMAQDAYQVLGRTKGKVALDALTTIKDEAGQAKTAALTPEISAKPVDIGPAKDNFYKLVEERLGAKPSEGGLFESSPDSVVSTKGELDLMNGFKRDLESLSTGANVGKLDKFVDKYQKLLYQAPEDGPESVNSAVEGVMKQTLGEINGQVGDTAGEAYKNANARYSEVIDPWTKLNKGLGPKYSTSGAYFRRATTPSAGEKVASTLKQVEDLTGVPLNRNLNLAKFADEANKLSLKDRTGLLKSIAQEGPLKGVGKYLGGKADQSLGSPQLKATRMLNKAAKKK